MIKRTIEKLDDDLNGVAFIGGKKYVCARTLPGEEVLMNEQRTSGNAVVCTLKKVLTMSSNRVKPMCKDFGICGGCALMMTSYAEQLLIKTALVRRKFSALGFTNIDDCVGASENPRNKVHICFSNEDGYIKAGFFNDETHRVVDIDYCIMHGGWYHDLVKMLIPFIKENNIEIYNPKTQKGILRFAVARKNECGIMLTLVVTRSIKLNYKSLYERLQKRFGNVTMYININDQKTNEVLSDTFIHIAGTKVLSGTIACVKYELSPDSFLQTNHRMAERIYGDINKITANIDGDIVDLFSGIGITSVLFAKNGRSVQSVEIVKSAVSNAQQIAKLNNVEDKIEFFTADCKRVLPKLNIFDKILFVDPPRAGLSAEVCDTILKSAPKNIIYLSCNLRTLTDDIKALLQKYDVKKVTPYDMFPNTKHVETLVTLELKEQG